jgi:hypothetical protein
MNLVFNMFQNESVDPVNHRKSNISVNRQVGEDTNGKFMHKIDGVGDSRYRYISQLMGHKEKEDKDTILAGLAVE